MRKAPVIQLTAALLTGFLSGISISPAANPPSFQAEWRVSHDPVYVGEQFYLTLEVVSREGSLTKNIQLAGLPPTQHLSCKPFADLPVEIRAIDDQICEIRRFRTIATLLQPGPCEIHVTLQGTQIRKIQNYFFTQREERPVSLTTTPIILNALPLPEANRPPAFGGAIGTGFALSAQIAPTSMVVGDLMTVTIQIQTANPLATFALPTTPHLPHFKLYPLKIEPLADNPQIHTFSQIVIPLSDQARTWGPVTFAYFDPHRGAYELLTQGPFELTFLPDRPRPIPDYRPLSVSTSDTAPNIPILALRTGRYSGFKDFAHLYAQRKFGEALQFPVSVGNDDPPSIADEEYNRGCAWLALGMGEKAAAVFRSGLYRAPRAPDLREGVRQAALALDSVSPRPPFILRLWDHATLGEWTALLGLGLGLLGTGLWFRRWLGHWAYVGAGLLVGGGLLLFLAVGGIRFRKDLNRYPEAILTPASTPVSLAPAESAHRYTDLPRGTWIRIRETNGDWIRISTESAAGWIPAASAEKVAPGQSNIPGQ